MTVDIRQNPPLLPYDVPRVDLATGRPTPFLLDFENSQSGWFARTVVDLQTQVDEVSAEAEGSTAGGQVILTAGPTPTGIQASYGWKLTVNDKFIGMFATLDNAGNAGITFTASQFLLNDPAYNGGAPRNVFAYAGGSFVFNVPVTIFNGNIAASAVTTGKVAVSSVNQLYQASLPAIVTVPVGAGFTSVLSVAVPGTAGAYALFAFDVTSHTTGTGVSIFSYRVVDDFGSVILGPVNFGTSAAGTVQSVIKFVSSVPATVNWYLQFSNTLSSGAGANLVIDYVLMNVDLKLR